VPRTNVCSRLELECLSASCLSTEIKFSKSYGAVSLILVHSADMGARANFYFPGFKGVRRRHTPAQRIYTFPSLELELELLSPPMHFPFLFQWFKSVFNHLGTDRITEKDHKYIVPILVKIATFVPTRVVAVFQLPLLVCSTPNSRNLSLGKVADIQILLGDCCLDLLSQPHSLDDSVAFCDTGPTTFEPSLDEGELMSSRCHTRRCR
jgi:hypothetical protein